MSRLIITRLEWEGKDRLVYATFDSERKLQDFQVLEEESEHLIGRIYAGRVDSIAENIHAAFVKITPDQMTYLPLSEDLPVIYTRKLSKRKGLHQGDEILVQVSRDAIKTKLPMVTTKLSLSGTYSVLNVFSEGCGVSKKIPQKQAAVLREFGNQFLKEMHDGTDATTDDKRPETGLLLRTNAAEVTEDLLLADLHHLYGRCEEIISNASHMGLYSLLWENAPSWIQRLKGLKISETEAIITDQQDVYDAISREFPEYSKGVLSIYKNDSISLAALYSLRSHLDHLTRRQVWLKSGANIIIEQLETLTFIDVNTAKNQSQKDGFILSVNLEAALEISRQIRMRNISGMILIDFINMKEEEQEELIRALKTYIRTDSVPCTFMDVTKLGLVELTRKKVYKSLREIL